MPNDTFAQILESMGVPPLARSAPAEIEPAPDSLHLSLQGSKALRPTQKESPLAIPAQPNTHSQDSQGNRICLSGASVSLSESRKGQVAWETRTKS